MFYLCRPWLAGFRPQLSGAGRRQAEIGPLPWSSRPCGSTIMQRIMENETQTNVLHSRCLPRQSADAQSRPVHGTRSGSIGKGLAAQESGAGTIISYSTQPGNVALDGTGGRNSPFAAALAKHLPSEGRDCPPSWSECATM